MTTLELSIVIPCHNEAGNLRALLAAIHGAVDPMGLDYEVVITDDCSTDESWSILQELAAADRQADVGDGERAGRRGQRMPARAEA